MGEARLHVVVGTGQAGSALAAQLPGLGVASGRCPGTGRSAGGPAGGPRMRPIRRWPTRPKGDSVVYQCVMPRYAVAEAIPAVAAAVLAPAGRTGALLVVEDLGGYGGAEDKADTLREKEKGHD